MVLHGVWRYTMSHGVAWCMTLHNVTRCRMVYDITQCHTVSHGVWRYTMSHSVAWCMTLHNVTRCYMVYDTTQCHTVLHGPVSGLRLIKNTGSPSFVLSMTPTANWERQMIMSNLKDLHNLERVPVYCVLSMATILLKVSKGLKVFKSCRSIGRSL